MEENPSDPIHNTLEDHPGFFQRELRSLEFRAYASILSAFRAGGELDEEKRGVLNIIRQTLSISDLRHKSEVRRVATNLRLATIANKLLGHNTSQEWLDEGFCEAPYVVPLSRVPPAKTPVILPSSPNEGTPASGSGAAGKSRNRKKVRTVHDFGRAVRSEKIVGSSTYAHHNGWASDGEMKAHHPSKLPLSKNKRPNKQAAEKSSGSESSESESSVDISYHSLKKKGRIRYQKPSKIKESKKKVSSLESSRPPPIATPKVEVVPVPPRSSPDITETNKPASPVKPPSSPVKPPSAIKKENIPNPAAAVSSRPGRGGRGAKRKIMQGERGDKAKQIPRKIKKLDTSENQENVQSSTAAAGPITTGMPSRGGRGSSRGLRGGRGVPRGGRGAITGRGGRGRSSLKAQQRGVIKAAPKPKIQHKRKQLDAVRVELKSDDSDKEDNKFMDDLHSLSQAELKRNRSRTPERRKSPSSDSDRESEKVKPTPDVTKPFPEANNNENAGAAGAAAGGSEDRLDQRAGNYAPVSKTETVVSSKTAEAVVKTEKSPAKAEPPDSDAKVELPIPEKPKTPPKVPIRTNPLPAPVFSTSLNNLNLKRTKLLNNFPPTTESLSSTASSLAATASSLARRPIFSPGGGGGPPLGMSPKGIITSKPGILPQRKAQPHILVNSKAQRNLSNANSSAVSSTSNVSNISTVPLISSNNPLSQSGSNTGPKPGGFSLPVSVASIQNFPVVNSQFAPMSYGPMKTSQGANIIFLQKAGNNAGVLTGSGAVVGSSTTIVSSAGANPGINTAGGVAVSAVNMQLPNKNSPRAVILRRANLPRQGNVMILDVQKNQVMNANQVPQFLQTARLLNAPPELALLAHLDQQGGAVRKIVSGAQVSTTPTLSVAASNSIVTAAISTTASPSSSLGHVTSNSITLANPGGFPIRFPINPTRLQQFQQNPAFKGKRVARVLSPALSTFSPAHRHETMKTVIRVNLAKSGMVPVVARPKLNIQLSSAPEVKDQPEPQPEVSEPEAPAENPLKETLDSAEVPMETCYEEEVVTSCPEETVISNDGGSTFLETEAAAAVVVGEDSSSFAFSNVESSKDNNSSSSSEMAPPSQQGTISITEPDPVVTFHDEPTQVVVEEVQIPASSDFPPQEDLLHGETIEVTVEHEMEPESIVVGNVEEVISHETVITTATTTADSNPPGGGGGVPAESEDIFQVAMKSCGLDLIQQAFELAEEENSTGEQVPSPAQEVTATTESDYPFDIQETVTLTTSSEPEPNASQS